jgi:Domain of unknown function (DUF4055)
MVDKKLEEQAADPSTVSEAYAEMAPKWERADALLGGTESMRAAGTIYLPQHPHEDSENYMERLNTSTLYNMFTLTLDSLVGKPFSDRLEPNNDVPEEIKELLPDIDKQGNDLHAFARKWFRTSLAKCFSHVFVDMPRPSAPENGVVRTMADDLKDKARPYAVFIEPQNVIFMREEEIDGEKTLVHVRIKEEIYRPYGFTEIETYQIRAYDLVKMIDGTYKVDCTVYELGKDRNNKPVWVQVDYFQMDIDRIPLVTFYADYESLMCGMPPLEDLAFLNIRHWQSTSDQYNILTVARFPMLAVSGAYDSPEQNVMAIGPRQLLATRAENGKFYYVEHSGKAIQAGNDDLEKLEQQMASYGAEFLRKRPGGQTATARALDSAESMSPLQDMTARFGDAMARMLSFFAKWMGLEEGGTIKIATDFGPEEVSDVDLRSLNEARRNRDLSRQQYLKEMIRRGALAEDFSFEDNLKELASEPQIISPFATGVNVGATGGANPNNPDGSNADPEDAKPKNAEATSAKKADANAVKKEDSSEDETDD